MSGKHRGARVVLHALKKRITVSGIHKPYVESAEAVEAARKELKMDPDAPTMDEVEHANEYKTRYFTRQNEAARVYLISAEDREEMKNPDKPSTRTPEERHRILPGHLPKPLWWDNQDDVKKWQEKTGLLFSLGMPAKWDSAHVTPFHEKISEEPPEDEEVPLPGNSRI